MRDEGIKKGRVSRRGEERIKEMEGEKDIKR